MKPIVGNPTWRRYFSYAFDWVLCIVLIAVFLVLDSIDPFRREFSVTNPEIMYTYHPEESVPVWALILIAVVAPVIFICLVGLGIRRSPYDVHNGVLGLLVSVLLTTMFTQVIKVTVGKHRPDFLGRCIPMLNGTKLTYDDPLRLWTLDVCTQTDNKVLQEGLRAFPSGHASTSFAGLFYFSLWMAGKMHIFDRRGYSIKGVILIVPIMGAMLVAISRVRDYRHSGIDVTWGSIIGILCATFAYFQYYPSLTSATSHTPHPPRDFSHLVKDGHEVSHIEQITGIEPNEDFVDESKALPQTPNSTQAEHIDDSQRELDDPSLRV
ncbi:hypothetical protein BG004_004030 [Podila humilis]|nr:hypothetical protein BG004_004030 [Podila humilis]